MCMKDELKEQDDGELEECIVQAAIRGFPLTAVEIAKGSPHPLEEKMLIVFDRSAQSFTENNAHVVSVFNYPTTKLNRPPQIKTILDLSFGLGCGGSSLYLVIASFGRIQSILVMLKSLRFFFCVLSVEF